MEVLIPLIGGSPSELVVIVSVISFAVVHIVKEWLNKKDDDDDDKKPKHLQPKG